MEILTANNPPSNSKNAHSIAEKERDCSRYRCSDAPPPFFHGRSWGAWTLDTERVCLVYDAEPVTRGVGADQYVAFLGGYEVDVEVIRQSSQVLDWIFQIRRKAWASDRVINDLLEAFNAIFHPQRNLCSNGRNKVIQNPKAFLKHRIETVGHTDDPLRDAA